MKLSLALLLLVVVANASAQWLSSFSPKKYPAQPAGGDALGNRFGATEGPVIDRFGFEIHQVNAVESMPEDKRPFWYRNRQAIAQHIGRNPASTQAALSSPTTTTRVLAGLASDTTSTSTSTSTSTTTFQPVRIALF